MSTLVCSSANFYRWAVTIQAELEKRGLKVIIPATAERMKQSGDFGVGHYKTWYDDESNYHKKAALMRGHFDEVAKGDAILVVNNEKHGMPNYIGGDVLMEMAVAFYLHQPIYILNEIPEESSFVEEIKGFWRVVVHGKLEELPTALVSA